MKKLFRVSVMAAGVIALLQVRTTMRAQPPSGGWTNPPTCCDQNSTSSSGNNPCMYCKGGPFDGMLGCNPGGGNGWFAGDCDGGAGAYNVFREYASDCQQNTNGSSCPTSIGSTCPSTYVPTYWGFDPIDCTTVGCFDSGKPCQSTSDCCSGLFCVGTVGQLTCSSCSVRQGYACYPPGASSACGTLLCDGTTCAAECSYNTQCWNGPQQGTCVSGCCQFDSAPNCVPNDGQPCPYSTSCGYYDCDGICVQEGCPGNPATLATVFTAPTTRSASSIGTMTSRFPSARSSIPSSSAWMAATFF